MFLFRACLKAGNDGADRTSVGRAFQDDIAYGRNELERSCVLHGIFRRLIEFRKEYVVVSPTLEGSIEDKYDGTKL